jgi:hypothetical protein
LLRWNGLFGLTVNLQQERKRAYSDVIACPDCCLLNAFTVEESAVARVKIANLQSLIVLGQLAVLFGNDQKGNAQIAIVTPANYRNVARQEESLL